MGGEILAALLQPVECRDPLDMYLVDPGSQVVVRDGLRFEVRIGAGMGKRLVQFGGALTQNLHHRQEETMCGFVDRIGSAAGDFLVEKALEVIDREIPARALVLHIGLEQGQRHHLAVGPAVFDGAGHGHDVREGRGFGEEAAYFQFRIGTDLQAPIALEEQAFAEIHGGIALLQRRVLHGFLDARGDGGEGLRRAELRPALAKGQVEPGANGLDQRTAETVAAEGAVEDADPGFLPHLGERPRCEHLEPVLALAVLPAHGQRQEIDLRLDARAMDLDQRQQPAARPACSTRPARSVRYARCRWPLAANQRLLER